MSVSTVLINIEQSVSSNDGANVKQNADTLTLLVEDVNDGSNVEPNIDKMMNVEEATNVVVDCDVQHVQQVRQNIFVLRSSKATM